MLKKKDGMKIAIRIALFIDLVLVAILICMCLKWFVSYLEIKSIEEIWPAGEFVILQCGLIFFAIAAIIFCVRMLFLDFERQSLKAKVKEYETFGTKADKVLGEDGEPVIRRVTFPKKEKKTQEIKNSPVESSELAKLRKELIAEKQWRANANTLYPDLEDRVAEFIESCPMS